MIIKISNGKKTKNFFVRKVFSFSAQRKINDIGKLKISFSTSIEGLEQFPIKKGYFIQAFLPQDNYKVVCIFSGYIEEIGIANNVVDVFAYDLISYCKYRLLREDKNYSNTKIKTIISEIRDYLNGISSLPFSLGKNNCEKKISIEFKKNTSLYTLLKELVKKTENLEFRQRSNVIKNDTQEFIEVSEQSGELLEGVRQDNALIEQRNSEIISWNWKDKFDKFCNYWMDDKGNMVKNQESIDEGLLFERYESNPETTPDVLDIHYKGLPKIVLNTSLGMIGKINLGDRKSIKIVSRVGWISFVYTGIIQEIKIVSSNSGGYTFSVGIGDKIVNQKNILDQTLEKYGDNILRLNRK